MVPSNPLPVPATYPVPPLETETAPAGAPPVNPTLRTACVVELAVDPAVKYNVPLLTPATLYPLPALAIAAAVIIPDGAVA
jgi:hypothetical protein